MMANNITKNTSSSSSSRSLFQRHPQWALPLILTAIAIFTNDFECLRVHAFSPASTRTRSRLLFQNSIQRRTTSLGLSGLGHDFEPQTPKPHTHMHHKIKTSQKRIRHSIRRKWTIWKHRTKSILSFRNRSSSVSKTVTTTTIDREAMEEEEEEDTESYCHNLDEKMQQSSLKQQQIIQSSIDESFIKEESEPEKQHEEFRGSTAFVTRNTKEITYRHQDKNDESSSSSTGQLTLIRPEISATASDDRVTNNDRDDSSTASSIEETDIVDDHPTQHTPVISENNYHAKTSSKEDDTTSTTTMNSYHSRRNTPKSDLEREFDDMLEHLCFSHAEIASITDLRVKIVLEGVVASAQEPAVYRAFQVLFEDLYPLRIAGRLIFQKLKHFMSESMQQQEKDVETVLAQVPACDRVVVEEVRQTFVTVANLYNPGHSYLTFDQLSETGVLDQVATEIFGFQTVQELLHQLVNNNRNKYDVSNAYKIEFCDLLIGLHQCVQDLCGIDQCNPNDVLQSVLKELQKHAPASISLTNNLDSSRKKYNKRYDEMVTQFKQWQHLIVDKNNSNISSTSSSRRWDVVRGCFVGANNPKVVDALRVVYVDYSGLRFAGDIIFKLVSSFFKNQKTEG